MSFYFRESYLVDRITSNKLGRIKERTMEKLDRGKWIYKEEEKIGIVMDKIDEIISWINGREVDRKNEIPNH